MTAPAKPATLRPHRKPQITGASDKMHIRTATPPRPADGGDPSSSPEAMKPAISPGHTSFVRRPESPRSPALVIDEPVRRSSHIRSSGWSMLGSNAMTLARIATARRQIKTNATQSRGRNRSSGDLASCRPAAEKIIGHPLEEWISDVPGWFPPAQSEIYAWRRSADPWLDVIGPVGGFKLC